MKKIFVLLACVVMTSSVFAQDYKPFSYGVKAGLNLSTFSGKDVSGAKIKPNFYAGVVTEFRISNLFAVSPELMYSGEGAKYKFENKNYNFNTSNLNLPVLAKFYVTKGLSLNVGPQFGYVLGAKADGEKVDKDFYNKFQVAAAVGATYNFGKLFVEARYNYGFTKFMKEAKNNANAIQVGLGYKF